MHLFFHHHAWSEWHESHYNKHPWVHVKTLERYCLGCAEREYQLLELFCPQHKKTGVYCPECARYGEEWDSHHLDTPPTVGYNEHIQESMKEKEKARRGRPSMLTRNIAMAIEYEFHPKWSIRYVGERHGIKDAKTAWTGINNGRRFVNMEEIKKAVG